MNRYKYLFKNIGLLTLSNFATKLLSFFLVPLYTYVLTTTQYGTYDLFNTTISVLIPLLTLNILEAVLRFGMDRNYDKEAIITLSFKWLSISSVIILVVILFNHFFKIFPILDKFKFYFFWMFFSQALSGIITSYARGTDHVAALSVSSVIASIVTIISNIVFLLPLHMGLSGYFIANIIGPVIQCVYLIFKLNIWKNVNIHKKFKNEERQMLAYSSPMIANSISWWINSVSDRYIVTWFCGLSATGIYSVSTKIPSILNIFQNIFNQAWALSAVKDFDPEDTNNFFSNTYRSYNCLMVLVGSFLIATDRILAKFLYSNEFYVAWKYVPFLIIAIVFGALSGYLGGFFTAVKDSKVYAISTIWGAIINVVLNFLTVPFLGILGAAFSTAVSYVVVWIVRLIQSKKYIKLKVNLKRDILSYIVLGVQTGIILMMTNNILMYIFQLILITLLLIMYNEEIRGVVKKFLRR